jgi:hypothetical protein
MDKRIVESKKDMRKQLAALSFTEKIKILEKLRDRSLAIAAAGPRPNVSKDAHNEVLKKGQQ